jgi:hypothetical protein
MEQLRAVGEKAKKKKKKIMIFLLSSECDLIDARFD